MRLKALSPLATAIRPASSYRRPLHRSKLEPRPGTIVNFMRHHSTVRTKTSPREIWPQCEVVVKYHVLGQCRVSVVYLSTIVLSISLRPSLSVSVSLCLSLFHIPVLIRILSPS